MNDERIYEECCYILEFPAQEIRNAEWDAALLPIVAAFQAAGVDLPNGSQAED